MRTIIIVLLAFAVSACGTVVRGTKQGVKFQSNPEGAQVTVVRAKKEKTTWKCTSPCELQLSRKRDFFVTFEKDGYKPARGRLASRFGAKGGATAIPGNFVAGGGIGFIVDAGTGANMQLKPDPMRATLARVGGAEMSVVHDVREDGEKLNEEFVRNDATSNVDSASNSSGLKRLPRRFGATGTAVDKTGDVGRAMAEPYGVLITQVQPDGAASRAGLKVGDVVQSINSNRVSAPQEVETYLADENVGDTASLVIWRDREQYQVPVEF